MDAQLERLARSRILFGHQSVGAGVMAGVARLVERERAPLRVVAVTSAADLAPGTLAHALVGVNGDPRSKLESFARLLGSGGPEGVDIALVKFCYADIEPGTDTASLFESYQRTLADLAASHPRTTFVHATAPLKIMQRGLRARAKRLLGRPAGTADNARRGDYNALVREAYEGREPIFDIARIESTAPGGETTSIVWGGRRVPVLVPAYTDDGGHLNAAGQERAARELVRVLASVVNSPG